MPRSAKEKLFVILAEDSFDDRLLLRAALSEVPHLKIALQVSGSAEVIPYLHGLARFLNRQAGAPPDLLLLALKMPYADADAVLNWLQEEADDHLTMAVLVDSRRPELITRALELGAGRFRGQGASPQNRQAVVTGLKEYLVKHPPAMLCTA